MLEAKIGQLVKSKAGRDKGQYMIVLDIIDANHVALVDGYCRKIGNPKKKKLKHLQLTTRIANDFVAVLQSGKEPTDENVQNALNSLLKS